MDIGTSLSLANIHLDSLSFATFQLSDATLLTTKKQNLNSYSPTTGTRQMSPSSSPMTHNAQNLRNRPSNG